jgi:hypothetical protein
LNVKTIIKKIGITTVDALIGKCADLPKINKKLIATKLGFTKDALEKAAIHDIECLEITDEINNEDWVSDNGEPIFKEINLIVKPIEIRPIIKIHLNKKHSDLQEEINKYFICEKENSIILEVNNEKISFDCLRDLLYQERQSSNNIDHEASCRDIVLYYLKKRISIDILLVRFELVEQVSREYKISIFPYVQGVIRYINKQKRKLIF